MAFDHQATKKGNPLYQDLKEKLRSAAIVHADETYWREDGLNHYVWYGGNDDLNFRIKKSLLFCNSISTLFQKACEIGKKFNNGEIHRNRSDAFKHRLYAVLNPILLRRPRH